MKHLSLLRMNMKVLNIFGIFSLCFMVLVCSASVLKDNSSKRVCVIGAGVAGITTARYLKESGINFTVLEATQYVGGTWRYDPRTGTDENGQPLHTSMYYHLRTNLPKPTMELKDFPLPDDLPSFPKWEAYYQYLQNYAKHFDLEKYIQFLHNVVLVRRENNSWKVRHEHVQTGEVFEEEYDFVVVGNGHFSKPNMPSFPGMDKFNGTAIHSHDYRVPDLYKNSKVLIVGAGPSGMDIAMDILIVAQRVFHSHHSRVKFHTKWPEHYTHKADIKELQSNGALFVDGTFEEVDHIIYCTGFAYDYPFLDETSELTITPRAVTPLYRYMVNINQPSMFIMGLVIRACLVVSLDAQARYATAMVKGNFTLPSREEMMQDWQHHVDVLKSKGLPISFLHVLGEKEDQYYAKLSAESGIDRVPPVMFKIRACDTEAKLEDLYTYRKYKYTVIDYNTFTRSLEKPENGSECAPHCAEPKTYNESYRAADVFKNALLESNYVKM